MCPLYCVAAFHVEVNNASTASPDVVLAPNQSIPSTGVVTTIWFTHPRSRLGGSAQAPSSQPLVQRVAQAVAQQVERQHRHEDGKSREQRHLVGDAEVVASLGQHRAPLRAGWLRPEADEAERGGNQDRRPDAQ